MKTNFLGSSGQNTLTVSQTLAAGHQPRRRRTTRRRSSSRSCSTPKGVKTVQLSIGSSGSSLRDAFTGGGGGITFSVTTDPDADQEKLQNTDRVRDSAAIKDQGDDHGLGVERLRRDRATSRSTSRRPATPTCRRRRIRSSRSSKKLDSIKQVDRQPQRVAAVRRRERRPLEGGRSRAQRGRRRHHRVAGDAADPGRLGRDRQHDAEDLPAERQPADDRRASCPQLPIPTATGPVALEHPRQR